MLAYAWLRAGRIFNGFSFEEALNKASEILQEPGQIKNETGWEQKIFPFLDYVSEEFRNEEFILSHLRQPFVWLHLKKGFASHVKQG